MPVAVKGFENLQRAFAKTERDVRLGWRKEVRQIAEPVRADAQELAAERIRNMPRSPKWAGMRTGVTRNAVYVAPRARSRAPDRRRKRPNLAPLLMGQAMEPALNRNQARAEREMEQLLDRAADQFNRTGL